MTRTIHLASGNAHKLAEFRALAAAYPPARGAIDLRPAVHMPPVAEDTGTFVGNARKKAVALRSILPGDAWVLADDSGLIVDALDGGPGVESAYFAGPEGNASANLRKLAEVMRDVPAANRQARFHCLLLLRGPGDGELIFEGDCRGVIAPEPSGRGGFGYDPIFVPEGRRCTYAELGEHEKNELSHRGHAWRALATWMERSRTR